MFTCEANHFPFPLNTYTHTPQDINRLEGSIQLCQLLQLQLLEFIVVAGIVYATLNDLLDLSIERQSDGYNQTLLMQRPPHTYDTWSSEVDNCMWIS